MRQAVAKGVGLRKLGKYCRRWNVLRGFLLCVHGSSPPSIVLSPSTAAMMHKHDVKAKLSLVLVLTLMSSCAWTPAESHGFLLQPMARSFVSYKFDPPETRDYNPQGVNAGGKQHVYDNGRLRWPNGRFGVCGDPWDAPVKRYGQAGTVTASYPPGSTISINLVITANHWGRMEFNLCPLNVTTSDFKQRCWLLQRADGKGPHWTLPPGELPDAQGRPLIPAYQDGFYSYYIYPEDDDFRQTPVYVVKYQLPQGVVCEHCMLHWYWLTGNSCNPPCETSDPLYPDCNRLQMGYCGDGKSLPPEEFWGCSDVRVGRLGAAINSSLERLADRLHAAEEEQDRAGRPQPPQRPKHTYWRAELLEQADQLDAAHHAAGHRRRHTTRESHDTMPPTHHAAADAAASSAAAEVPAVMAEGDLGLVGDGS